MKLFCRTILVAFALSLLVALPAGGRFHQDPGGGSGSGSCTLCDLPNDGCDSNVGPCTLISHSCNSETCTHTCQYSCG